MPSDYAYEPRPPEGKERPKHKWNEPRAGFKPGRAGELEGMCPSNIPVMTVLDLLNNGLPHFVPGKPDHPKSIFNVHDGVPYKAHVTRRGESYHGFPCRASDIPPGLWRPLLALALQRNCKREVEEWLKDNP